MKATYSVFGVWFSIRGKCMKREGRFYRKLYQHLTEVILKGTIIIFRSGVGHGLRCDRKKTLSHQKKTEFLLYLPVKCRTYHRYMQYYAQSLIFEKPQLCTAFALILYLYTTISTETQQAFLKATFFEIMTIPLHFTYTKS